MIGFENNRIVVSRHIRCRMEDVWLLVTDTEQWERWGPSVSRVRSAQRFIGPESTGTIRTALGFRVSFAITDYQHLRCWSWRVGGFQATGHRLSAVNEQTCRLSFDLPWWAFPYAAVCLVALTRIGRICESGELRG